MKLLKTEESFLISLKKMTGKLYPGSIVEQNIDVQAFPVGKTSSNKTI